MWSYARKSILLTFAGSILNPSPIISSRRVGALHWRFHRHGIGTTITAWTMHRERRGRFSAVVVNVNNSQAGWLEAHRKAIARSTWDPSDGQYSACYFYTTDSSLTPQLCMEIINQTEMKTSPDLGMTKNQTPKTSTTT